MAEHDGCKGCAYVSRGEHEMPCIKCVQNASDNYKRMTNADRIRTMSNEELLDFICSELLDFICSIETYDDGSAKTIEGSYALCSAADVEKWLQSEVESKA